MVVDTSALAAILLREPEEVAFAESIAAARRPMLSAANFVEFGILAGSRRAYPRPAVESLVARWGLEIVPVSLEQARLAVEAFARYGKGKHPAGLNHGDCFAYALAKERGEPLLFKGQDFARTDVTPALSSA
jgi:ribonuclease VapC